MSTETEETSTVADRILKSLKAFASSDADKAEEIIRNCEYISDAKEGDGLLESDAVIRIARSAAALAEGNPLEMVKETLGNLEYVSKEGKALLKQIDEITNHPAWEKYKENFLSNLFSDL